MLAGLQLVAKVVKAETERDKIVTITAGSARENPGFVVGWLLRRLVRKLCLRDVCCEEVIEVAEQRKTMDEVLFLI
jgi:hypothetical protein